MRKGVGAAIPAVVAIVSWAGLAAAQDMTIDPDVPPFEEILEGATVAKCLPEVQASIKDCTIAVTFTKTAGYQICFCDRNGVNIYDKLPIPEGERNLTRLSELSILKLTQGRPDSAADPCQLMTISGKRTKVCW